MQSLFNMVRLHIYIVWICFLLFVNLINSWLFVHQKWKMGTRCLIYKQTVEVPPFSPSRTGSFVFCAELLLGRRWITLDLESEVDNTIVPYYLTAQGESQGPINRTVWTSFSNSISVNNNNNNGGLLLHEEQSQIRVTSTKPLFFVFFSFRNIDVLNLCMVMGLLILT